MREIEFKAWNVLEKLMTSWDDIKFLCRFALGIEEIFNNNRFIPLQFTGLKDKNGKKIFESDIVKISPGFGCIFNEAIGVVKYEYASFWLMFKTGSSVVLDDHNCDLEVLGNIYENRDLMPEGIFYYL